MREPPKLPIEDLRVCLQDHYGLFPVSLEFLPLGLDYRAGVYRVVSEQGAVYLLKVKSGALYEPGYLVPGYLRNQGITAVVAPLLTRQQMLWSAAGDWTVIVYPFLDGETSWTGMTDEQWKQVGAVFQRIHGSAMPPSGFESLRRETFDLAEYTRWIHELESRLALAEASRAQPDEQERTSEHILRENWTAQRSTIRLILASMEKLAAVLQSRAYPFVVCHADLHPANLLRDPSGRVFVLDWDEVMLAPKERDFLFIKASSADSDVLPGTSAFFQGYGRTDIDWIALTYYRYERALQDLIACAQEVLCRDDLGEETKGDSVRLFRAILAEGGEIEAAAQASTHLPSDLILPTIMIARIERELAGREEPDMP